MTPKEGSNVGDMKRGKAAPAHLAAMLGELVISAHGYLMNVPAQIGCAHKMTPSGDKIECTVLH